LLRKIKNLFNLSPVDFIRLIRLKKAAEFIQEGKFRIGDICFMVGINSPSYFGKLFLKQFGMTPKEFEKQNEEKRHKM
jgi:AraC-like DNA-binding protein